MLVWRLAQKGFGTQSLRACSTVHAAFVVSSRGLGREIHGNFSRVHEFVKLSVLRVWVLEPGVRKHDCADPYRQTI